jgi:hypothetical protein
VAKLQLRVEGEDEGASPNNNLKLAKIVSIFLIYFNYKFNKNSSKKGEGGTLVVMHLDWLFAFVIPVARFSIEQAINDSACPASDMATCSQ